MPFASNAIYRTTSREDESVVKGLMVRASPFNTSEKRVEWQDEIHALNRRGVLDNATVERLLDLLNDPTRLARLKKQKRRFKNLHKAQKVRRHRKAGY